MSLPQRNRHVHAMCFSAAERHEALTDATTWANLDNI